MKYSLLRKKNFSILVMSGFISLIGTEMLNFSLSLYVLQITHSATLFSTVLAISIIPTLALGPFGGVIIDWVNKFNNFLFTNISRNYIWFLWIANSFIYRLHQLLFIWNK